MAIYHTYILHTYLLCGENSHFLSTLNKNIKSFIFLSVCLISLLHHDFHFWCKDKAILLTETLLHSIRFRNCLDIALLWCTLNVY